VRSVLAFNLIRDSLGGLEDADVGSLELRVSMTWPALGRSAKFLDLL